MFCLSMHNITYKVHRLFVGYQLECGKWYFMCTVGLDFLIHCWSFIFGFVFIRILYYGFLVFSPGRFLSTWHRYNDVGRRKYIKKWFHQICLIDDWCEKIQCTRSDSTHSKRPWVVWEGRWSKALRARYLVAIIYNLYFSSFLESFAWFPSIMVCHL